MSRPDLDAEWLEPDGLGGFASGTVGGVRRRRYHATLLAATTPPTGRVVLVKGFDAWIERANGAVAPEFLTVQRYAPDVTTRDFEHLVAFASDPWPTWTYRLADGTEIEHQLFVPHDRAMVAMAWRLVKTAPGLRLVLRPFLAGCDAHVLHHENPALLYDAEVTADQVHWRSYRGLPAVASAHNGSYVHAPVWYRGFQLDEERARGFDYLEDAASPGLLSWQLSHDDAIWLLAAEGVPGGGAELLGSDQAQPLFRRLCRDEARRRARFPGRLDRAADAYLARRGEGKTIIAGYPWFTDWGRDTFIALRGLCLVTGRLDEACAILLQWAGTVSQGMLPNRFLEQGAAPEFNSVDASLWFVVALHETLGAFAEAGKRLPLKQRETLLAAVAAILEGYAGGTRFRIGMDQDGLLFCGEPGVQVTWMDAKVGDWVVTPRIGKPVEVQALWINALRIGGALEPRWGQMAARATAAFAARFWNGARGCLYDVVDADRVPGKVDQALRPNQIFAVGGLPHPLLDGERARAVVDTVERELLTPLGLRSLAPGEPGYQPRYEGGPRERDAAYHQGTAWPWLLGAFVEAWLRVRGDAPESRAEARRRFFEPLVQHLDMAGLGHISEIADAEPPFTPRGCPFQAWSVGEAIRVDGLTRPAVPSRRAPRRRKARSR